MFRAPAAWVRSRTVPDCARGWPSAIGAAFSGDRGPWADRVEALRGFAGQRWVGWLLVAGPGRTDGAPSWRTIAPAVVQTCHDIGAAGVVLNAEDEWRGASDDDARALVEYFTSRGVHVALCTYALPPRDFPLAGFAGASVGISETYDRDARLEDGYLAQSEQRWRSMGWRSQWVACVGLWNHAQDRVKNEDELSRHLRARPRDCVVWGPQVWPRRVCEQLTRWQREQSREPTREVPSQAAIAAALLALFTWLASERT